MKRLVFALALGVLVGCSDFSVPLRDTAVTLTSDRTSAAVGEPFEFRYSVQGRSLAGLVIDYGDGALDSIGLQGAQTATGVKTHAYSSSGSFVASGRVEDFTGVSKTAEIAVTVNPE